MNENNENSNKKSKITKNENIVSAIMSLIKELDTIGLEIIKKEVDKKLKSGQSKLYND